MADNRRSFLEALKQVDAALYRAFIAAVDSIRNAADVRAVERAVETGDPDQVAAALNLTDAAFEDLARAIEDAFRQGAMYQNGTAPKAESPVLQVLFSTKNPRAEAWMRRNAAGLVSEVLDDQKALIRETITRGQEVGQGYRKTAMQLVGRVDGNRRKGGIVGLHSTQARAVARAREQLEALDPAYFSRVQRDKRFDATIRRAIREGKPLSADVIEKITGRYSDRLLALRGRIISRTEGNKAMQAGRVEAVQQMLDNGTIQEQHLEKIWDATPDTRTRDSHAALNGTSVPWAEDFVSPVTGAHLHHPHDEDAAASETVGCRCTMRVRIDWVAVAAWRSAA